MSVLRLDLFYETWYNGGYKKTREREKQVKNYIIQTTGLYDNDTHWLSSDDTLEDIMWEEIRSYGSHRMDITIMEVDTLEVDDDEEGYTPGDIFDDYLRDGKDGDTASGITRLGLWEMVPTMVKA